MDALVDNCDQDPNLHPNIKILSSSCGIASAVDLHATSKPIAFTECD